MDTLNTITRYLLSTDYGPVDRIVELGIFLLIAYRLIVNSTRHRRDQKQREGLDGLVATLFDLLDEGEHIQCSLGNLKLSGYAGQTAWINSVRNWTDKTTNFLNTHSHRALLLFQIVSYEVSWRGIIVVQPNSSESFAIEGDAKRSYLGLVSQLDSLRRILERPERYF